MNPLPAFTFRWRSFLGLAVVIFLLWGALNFALAVIVPVSLHGTAAWAQQGLILGQEMDAAVLGPTLTAMSTRDPGFRAYLVSFMDTMCAFMMAYALLDLAVAWYGLRRGWRWALWTLAVANLAIAPYYLAIGLTYARFGVPFQDTIPGFTGVPALITLAATASGWWGLRQAGSAPAIRA